MKYINSLLITLLVLGMVLAACTINPVRPQAVYEATATARAEVALLPTVTPSPQPPMPTIAPVVAPEEPVATVDCEIKVNRSANGELIYHLPGQPTYGRTKVDPEKDEFYACTEQDAIDAGARRALR